MFQISLQEYDLELEDYGSDDSDLETESDGDTNTMLDTGRTSSLFGIAEPPGAKKNSNQQLMPVESVEDEEYLATRQLALFASKLLDICVHLEIIGGASVVITDICFWLFYAECIWWFTQIKRFNRTWHEWEENSTQHINSDTAWFYIIYYSTLERISLYCKTILQTYIYFHSTDEPSDIELDSEEERDIIKEIKNEITDKVREEMKDELSAMKRKQEKQSKARDQY